LLHPLALALTVGLGVQLALAVLPDPGLGPASSGLEAVRETPAAALHIFASNLLTVALLTAGGLALGLTVVGRASRHPRPRLIAYVLLLAVAGWLYFVTGVHWLATDLDLTRPQLTARLVHGYLEWPALLLPWAAIAFAATPRRRLDLRLVGAACACSVAMLLAAAMIEAFVVPGLLGTAA
jgi:hypothetical protein